MKEKPIDNTYEYYQYVARTFAEKGNHVMAKIIMEMMIEKWPERRYSRSEESYNPDIFDEKLDR